MFKLTDNVYQQIHVIDFDNEMFKGRGHIDDDDNDDIDYNIKSDGDDISSTFDVSRL